MPSQCRCPARRPTTESARYATIRAVYPRRLVRTCAERDGPLPSRPALDSPFTLVVPNVCHDMHDCSVSAGDRWLHGFTPKVLKTSEYRSGTTAIFITGRGGGKRRGESRPTGRHRTLGTTGHSGARQLHALLPLANHRGDAEVAGARAASRSSSMRGSLGLFSPGPRGAGARP
jgi:hypothetical protein